MQRRAALSGCLQITSNVSTLHMLTIVSTPSCSCIRSVLPSPKQVAVKRAFSSSRASKSRNPILHRIAEVSADNQFLLLASHTNNPYHNLAIETFLLRHSHPTSRIAFFYTNTPSVVIGRNQNPWLECNIAAIQTGFTWHAAEWNGLQREKDGKLVPVDLIRRRSGGGTVVHDEGNLNFSFIAPNDKTFTRTEGAETVVRALKAPEIWDELDYLRNYEDVKVNERHDIVMRKRDEDNSRWLKASGSAYKLIKGRSLHHGTLLHSSPNLTRRPGDAHSPFGNLLQSPAKDYVDAKGVGSVSSPVHNLFSVSDAKTRTRLRESLIARIQQVWQHSYGVSRLDVTYVGDDDCTRDANEHIFKDAQELMTDEWRFLQTPGFTFTSATLNQNFQVTFEVNRGVILKAGTKENDASGQVISDMPQLTNRILHQIDDWHKAIQSSEQGLDRTAVAQHLDRIFPRINPSGALESVPPPSDVGKAWDSGNAVRREKGNQKETELKGQNTVIEQ